MAPALGNLAVRAGGRRANGAPEPNAVLLQAAGKDGAVSPEGDTRLSRGDPGGFPEEVLSHPPESRKELRTGIFQEERKGAASLGRGNRRCKVVEDRQREGLRGNG